MKMAKASHPGGFLRLLFRAPAWLYRWRLGWLFGRNRLMVAAHPSGAERVPRLRYDGSEQHARRLAAQLPVIAFRPAGTQRLEG